MKLKGGMDVNLDELAKEIKRNTARSLSSLNLRLCGNIVFISGIATSFYAKQMAIHVVKNAGLEVHDKIVVKWPSDPIDQ